MSSDPYCQPILTPDDCHPYLPVSRGPSSPIPVGDSSPHSPGQSPAGGAGPTAPHTIPSPLEKFEHLHLFDFFSAIVDVIERSLVIGAAVIVVLIFVVSVAAARPLEPARLRNFTTAALPLPVVSAIAGRSWTTPLSLLWSGAGKVAATDFSGLPPMLLLALPVGMAWATWWWANFLHKNASVGQKSLARTERFTAKITERRNRSAARTAANGAPYTLGGNIILGVLAEHVSAAPLGVWRSLTARYQPWLLMSLKEIGRHVALVGSTGSGKTTLLERYFVATLTAAWTAWYRWHDIPRLQSKYLRPLMVMIACKGGQDDKVLGEKIRDISLCLGIAPDRIGVVVPGGDRLNIWDMPARDLRGVLADLLISGEASTSEGQHFDEMRKRIVSLVVDAPIGPPASSIEFLDRLNPAKLIDAWHGAPDVVRQVTAMQQEKVPQIDDVLIKLSNLFDQLKDHNGQGVFDGGRDLNDLDVLFVTVPGMDKDAARAQVAAILRMVMQKAGRTKASDRRAVYLALDEASAVATAQGSIGLEQVAERGRSQGISITFSAQSKEGLARDPWSLSRILSSCAGGMLLGYSEEAGDLSKHAGSIRRMLPSRHLIKGQRHGDEGQVSYGEKWLVDPDRIRQMQTGDVVYARGGHAWYGRVVPVDMEALAPLPGTGQSPTEPAEDAVPSAE